MPAPTPPAVVREIQRLHLKGVSSATIAQRVGVSRNTAVRHVGLLRAAIGVELARPRFARAAPVELEAFIHERLEAGETARSIAISNGLAIGPVKLVARKWREARNMPLAWQRVEVDPLEAERLIREGLSQRDLARHFRCSVSTAGRIRAAFFAGLPEPLLCGCGRTLGHKLRCTVYAQPKHPRARKAAPADHAGLSAAVARHIPRTLDRALRDDIIGELCLAVLAGEVPPADIAQHARRFINAGFAKWADQFRSRSLDTPIGDEDSRTLGDMIEDETSMLAADEMKIGR